MIDERTARALFNACAIVVALMFALPIFAKLIDHFVGMGE